MLHSWSVVVVAQLVRASDCGSEGRGFKSLQPPQEAFSRPYHAVIVLLSAVSVLDVLLKQGVSSRYK